jgi:hypothetical protein
LLENNKGRQNQSGQNNQRHDHYDKVVARLILIVALSLLRIIAAGASNWHQQIDRTDDGSSDEE